MSIIANKFDKADVSLNSTFLEDLGADSLDIVEMVMAVEEEFGIEIPDPEVENVKHVQHMVEHVHKKVTLKISKESSETHE